MYTINKSFNIAYGHSVHAQTLNKELALDDLCKCRWWHGHNGDVNVYVESETLDAKGMVLDFKELNFFKKFLDNVVDHKFIIDINDPALQIFFPNLSYVTPAGVTFTNHEELYYTVGSDVYNLIKNEREKEIYEGLVIVDFIPTAENLAKWFFEIIQNKLGKYAKVRKVSINETPKACATYEI